MNRLVDWARTTGQRVLTNTTAIRSHTLRFARCIHLFVREFEPWGIIIALLGLTMALFTIVMDLEGQQSERTFRAWQIVWGFESRGAESSATLRTGASGSSLRKALEFLNQDFDGILCASWVSGVSLRLTGNPHRTCFIPEKKRESLAGFTGRGADLSGINLQDGILTEANLQFADLRSANLMGAMLTGANLAGAKLTGGDLTGAKLSAADLTFADLTFADLTFADLSVAYLTSAKLTGADLTGAILTGAVLTDADLSSAKLGFSASHPSVTQAQLDAACGISSPLSVPAGLVWRSAPCRSIKEYVDELSSR